MCYLFRLHVMSDQIKWVTALNRVRFKMDEIIFPVEEPCLMGSKGLSFCI